MSARVTPLRRPAPPQRVEIEAVCRDMAQLVRLAEQLLGTIDELDRRFSVAEWIARNPAPTPRSSRQRADR